MAQTTTLPISISQFAADALLLNTPLWSKQREILEEFWSENYSIAVWALGRRSGKTLMAAVPTWEVNPTISAEFLEQEKARDPELFAVEYGANFSQSLSGFIDSNLVDAAINCDRGPLPPLDKFKDKYYLSLDLAKVTKER